MSPVIKAAKIRKKAAPLFKGTARKVLREINHIN
jgi:hypothetical protein